MVWFVFAFLAALFSALMAVFKKKSLKDVDEYFVGWSWRFFTVLFLIPLLLFTKFEFGDKFWIALLIGGSLNAINTIIIVKAIKESDISITMPMISFTPLFILILSPLIINELPSFTGLIGVLLIVLGAYFLKIKEIKKGLLVPFKSLFKEKGPRLMLLAAFIWSITSIYDKIGTLNSSPILWSFLMNLFIVGLISPIMLYKSKNKISLLKTKFYYLIPIGLFGAAMAVSQMTAVSIGIVSYVISIKRTSILLSVLFGFFVFKEKNIKPRLMGAIIMILGVLLITLA